MTKLISAKQAREVILKNNNPRIQGILFRIDKKIINASCNGATNTDIILGREELRSGDNDLILDSLRGRGFDVDSYDNDDDDVGGLVYTVDW
jgi:hypothetical protein